MRDFKRLRQDPPQGVNGSPNPDNIMLWNAVIFGPEDTPWDGGTLQARQPLHATGCAVGARCCCAAVLMSAPHASTPAVLPAATAPGTFKLTLEFSEDYPNKAPVVKFKSTMFHPNSELCVAAVDQALYAAAALPSMQAAFCLHPSPVRARWFLQQVLWATHWLCPTTFACACPCLCPACLCALLQSTLMAASAWTSCKTSGAPSMMCQPS